MMNLLEHAVESVENAAEKVVDKVEDVLGMDTEKKEDSTADEVGPEIPQEIPQESPQVSEEVPREVPQETPETQEPSLLERFEEAVGLKKPEDAAEPAQREVDKANRSLEQPSVASNIRQGQTQPSRAVYAHPGSFQKGNQIQEPQVSGFARHMAHAHDAPVQSAQPAPAVALTSSHSSSVLMASQAHAPVHNAQAAPTASLPSSPISSVPAASQARAPVQYVQPAPAVAQPSRLSSSVSVASQAHAPVQYAQPLPVAAQAPVKQTSTAQNIPPNFVPMAPASSHAAPASVVRPPAATVTTFQAPAKASVAPVVSTPAPASSYVSPSSAAPQAAHTASATYSVPTVIAQPPGAMQLSRAAQVAPHVTGQTAPLVGQTAYAARAVQSRQ